MTHTDRIGTTRRALLFALASILSSAAFAQDKALPLAETRPTPCLDVVVPLFGSALIQSGAHSVLGGMGQAKHLSAAWAPGNQYYDRAYAIVYKALSSDDVLRAQLLNLKSQTYLQLQFRGATPQDQEYLRTFFASPEGIVYWDYLEDGAACGGLLTTLSRPGVVLTKDQSEVSETWRQRLAVSRKEFEAILPKFTPAQKENFEKGHKLLSRLAPDKNTIQASLVTADQFVAEAKKSLQPVTNDLAQLVNEAAKNQH